MDRRIIWAERSSADIEAIVRYVRRRDRRAAARIGEGIYARVQVLLEYPETGSLLRECPGSGWRKLMFRRWKIIYRIDGPVIVVARVWPAAMGDVDFDASL